MPLHAIALRITPKPPLHALEGAALSALATPPRTGGRRFVGAGDTGRSTLPPTPRGLPPPATPLRTHPGSHPSAKSIDTRSPPHSAAASRKPAVECGCEPKRAAALWKEASAACRGAEPRR